MKSRQFVTIQIPSRNEVFDLEVPADRSINEILPLILKGLNYPPINPQDSFPYTLWKRSGEKLISGHTFQQAGILNFDVLVLDSKSPVPAVKHEAHQSVIEFTTKIEERKPEEPQPAIVNEPTPLMEKTPEGQSQKTIQEKVAFRRQPGIVVPRKQDLSG